VSRAHRGGAIAVDGVAVIDKPPGCTSHDVVARCRRIFSQKRVGHAGTLDPDATGVLLVGLGQATRLLQFLSGLPKRYQAEVVLGVSTTTLDAAGDVTGIFDMGAVTVDEARAAAVAFTGDISQVPPMVSALKVGGRRLHELARAGVEIERAPRQVSVTRFDVGWAGPGDHGPVLAIDVECSTGTYVRSLAADLGAALGGGAHLRNLRRLAVGEFLVEQAVSLEVLASAPDPAHALMSPDGALARAGLGRAVVDQDLAAAVAHGKVLPVALLRAAGAVGAGPWAVVSEESTLLAVYQAHRDEQAKPVVVLSSPG
jgi:tRNA pseudouridine55 synthase